MKHIPLPPPPPPPTPISLPEFLTGRLPIRNGIFTSFGYPLDMVFRVFMPISEGGLPADEITIPDMLKAANYTSTLVGWELQYPGLIPRPSSVGLHGNEPSITHMLLQCSLVRSPLSTLFILQPTKAVLRGLGMRLVVTYSLPVETFATGKV